MTLSDYQPVTCAGCGEWTFRGRVELTHLYATAGPYAWCPDCEPSL